MKTLLVSINAKFIHSNLAIRYLKSFADSKGDFEIDLIEFTINQQLELIMREILKKTPECIGFSCYIWNYEFIQKLTIELKKLIPNTKIFLGGPEVSYNSVEVLSQTGCDGVICGEGEDAFFQLVSGIPWGNITGMTTIDSENGSGKLLALAEIPFVYDSYSELLNRIVYYESSRGCPFNCQYCLSSSGKNVRFLPLKRVFSDLQKFLNANIPQVKFIDRTFNCDKNYSMGIWEFLSENDNGITNFHFEIAAELLDDTMIEFLQTVRRGLFQFEIGVQSTNPETLVAIKRNTDKKLLTKIVGGLQKNQNIHLHLDLIAGLPYEKYFQFGQSFDFVHSLFPDQLQLGFLKLLKGSGLYPIRESYGLCHTSFPPYEITQTKWLSYTEILDLKMIEEVVEIYYNSNRFKLLTKFLVTFFASPFIFYEALSKFYEENSQHLRPHPKVEYYEILREFFVLQSPNIEQLEQFKTFALYDIYSHEKAKRLPNWLEKSDLFRKEIFDFIDNHYNVEQYLSEYSEFDTKQIIRNIHIEIFPYNPVTFEKIQTAILFNYRNCDLLGNAKTINITL